MTLSSYETVWWTKGPRLTLIASFSNEGPVQFASQLSLHRDHFICAQSVWLFGGQSVWSLPCPCTVLLPKPIMSKTCHRFHSLGFRLMYLGHKTLSICSYLVESLGRALRERERCIQPGIRLVQQVQGEVRLKARSNKTHGGEISHVCLPKLRGSPWANLKLITCFWRIQPLLVLPVRSLTPILFIFFHTNDPHASSKTQEKNKVH